ncbi:hypothetical protein INR49_028154, partial [Caranx melampygus]
MVSFPPLRYSRFHLQRPDPDVHTYQPDLHGDHATLETLHSKPPWEHNSSSLKEVSVPGISTGPLHGRDQCYCGNEAAGLYLTLPGNTTSLQFTFRKERKVVYISTLTAHVFSSLLGLSARDVRFKCISENLLVLSSELTVKLVPLQVQAFTCLMDSMEK